VFCGTGGGASAVTTAVWAELAGLEDPPALLAVTTDRIV
jgi:hypothetical protein